MIATQYLPWKGQSIEKYRVPSNSKEFEQMEKIFSSTHRLDYLIEQRDENRYMQFLVRQQFLYRLYPQRKLYIVKKFIAVQEQDIDKALKYNLDPRRVPVSDTFTSDLSRLSNADVIFVVLVTTDEPYIDFIPTRDSDYYIQYIAYLNDRS